MAERERPDGTEPEEQGQGQQPSTPLDEAAAWAQLIAAYDDEPESGAGSWPAAEDLPAADDDAPDDAEQATPDEPASAPPAPKTTSIVIHPVIAGPRDFEITEEDEGHFVPPEPPPLPETDVTTKFAWLAVLGGPALIFAFILLQQELPWWAITTGIGGFIGGFATLVARMRPGGDDEDDLPGGGAVV
ncbi:hypothetical protein [Actinacidiphila soli]|uniref:hypothetical protein n=1 Tax=Actinacidiphila soli TaxID=2487275 RepID=UPI000FCB5A83|nr:hypothetical protein [Actinacidiphila soli]